MASKPHVAPSHVKPVNLGKAMLSFLIDLGLTVAFIAGFYYAIGRTLIMPAAGYDGTLNEWTSFVNRADLLDEKNSGSFQPRSYRDTESTKPEDYAYKKYVNLVWNYFMGVVVDDADYRVDYEVSVVINNVTKTHPAYTGTLSKTSQEYGKWVYQGFFGYDETLVNNDFVPSAEADFTSIPVASKDEATYHNDLAVKMYDASSGRGLYVNAINQLASQPRLSELQTKLSNANYLSKLPGYVIAPLIFFFILPLCIPNGRTLGKLFLGTSVIAFSGLKAKKWAIALRQGIITVIWYALILPWSTFAFPLFGLLMLAGYMSRVLSKSNQALHDRIAGTLVVLNKDSVWFDSFEQRDQYAIEHPEAFGEEEEEPQEGGYDFAGPYALGGARRPSVVVDEQPREESADTPNDPQNP